ncbi:hypothetical protein IRZ83_09420 [Flavobacterium sp. JLP]|uniref:hypothetical protein n=1 Tax=Flavobacterium sp. JLP TaxID=2783793 RepID=UPI00188AA47B|nr:hypothetical protein [Flavobacterium sp. JLP]MBF4506890.1 hypothetical protein [Flavobacterium sp. JLP]
MHSFLVNLGYVLLALNFILYAVKFPKKDPAYKIFTVYILVMIGVQLSAKICMLMHASNLFLSHLYFIGQFIMLSFFYLKLVKDQFQKKAIKIGFVLVLLTLAIQYEIKPELFLKFNLYEIFITSFLLIIYATFHFYNMLEERRTFYFINMGILLYLFGSTILFLVGNLTVKFSKDFNMVTWLLNAILYVIYQLFILYEWKVSFYKNKKEEFIN